jgi:hypothetical protein
MVQLRVSPFYRSLQNSRTALRSASIQQYRHAHESYGGGEGNPKGENPQQQGSNPSAEKEHPGPPPPAEGQGTGGGPTKATESGHNTPENASSNDHGNKNKGNGVDGAQPKILNQGVPAEESEDVKQHNAEYAKRFDRPDTKAGDQDDQKVDPKYWSGRFQSFPTSSFLVFQGVYVDRQSREAVRISSSDMGIDSGGKLKPASKYWRRCLRLLLSLSTLPASLSIIFMVALVPL